MRVIKCSLPRSPEAPLVSSSPDIAADSWAVTSEGLSFFVRPLPLGGPERRLLLYIAHPDIVPRHPRRIDPYWPVPFICLSVPATVDVLCNI